VVTNLKRAACFAALAATAALAVAQPSHATLMQAVFTGTINADLIGGAGSAGFFGLQEDQLIGQAFTMTFRYDTSLGTLTEGDGQAILEGGATPGTTSPVLSSTLTINRVTLSIPSVVSSDIGANDGSGGQTPGECIQSFGFSAPNDATNIDACLSIPSTPQGLDFSAPFEAHGGGGDVSDFSLIDEATARPFRLIDITGRATDLVVTRVSDAGGGGGGGAGGGADGAGVPEPTTWALLIAGFGLAGARLRARKPALSRSSSCSS